ncbi:MAG: helix-turn-helix domain-containing protein [Planctomycetota bacterium]
MTSPSDDRRSCCPVACTLDLIGDRWTLLVVRDLFAGRTRFSEFLRSPEGIATNVLTDRLDRLVEAGLVERHVEPPGKRAAYRLTKAGKSLRPLLGALRDWGLRHIEGTEVRIVT